MTDIFDDDKPREWDPPEHERTYYRSANDGQLGWLVIREGRQMIKLDRGSQDLCVRYNASDWLLEREHRPLTRVQAAQVAYEADIKLCLLLGDFEPRRQWNMLPEERRITFANSGPPAKPAVRAHLFKGIMRNLERVSR